MFPALLSSILVWESVSAAVTVCIAESNLTAFADLTKPSLFFETLLRAEDGDNDSFP